MDPVCLVPAGDALPAGNCPGLGGSGSPQAPAGLGTRRVQQGLLRRSVLLGCPPPPALLMASSSQPMGISGF